MASPAATAPKETKYGPFTTMAASSFIPSWEQRRYHPYLKKQPPAACLPPPPPPPPFKKTATYIPPHRRRCTYQQQRRTIITAVQKRLTELSVSTLVVVWLLFFYAELCYIMLTLPFITWTAWLFVMLACLGTFIYLFVPHQFLAMLQKKT